MQKDIAIIGMAGRFPGAAGLQELYTLLAAGGDSISTITSERIKRTTLDPAREYMTAGYLTDIDVFDHQLFNISAGEAQTMDPHMRLLLEVAYETFENAAYAVDEVRQSNTAVFVADAALEYYNLAETFVPTLASGNTKAFLAAMLSKQFDLRGSSLMVDTTCSSSLLAVHLACNELLLGDADMALACGANLYLFPYKQAFGLDLDAPDGRSKAFSAQANGMSHGEAVACMLLKKLDKAQADGDIIHAIIKGSAVNSNAARSASITAPDSEAQADVIRKAWAKAGIDPRRIGFIEAHGSGTVLGDNIEIGGFTLAFNDHTTDKQWCPVSTIKSNIGHTRSAAGMAGLLKAVLSLKNRILFPSAHFDAPHPQINFNRSAVFINDRLRPWISENGPRYAGVSSIGLSGTNCHMVLEEAPEIRTSFPEVAGNYLLPVSANTREELKKNVQELINYLSGATSAALSDISYTLWRGRKHYDHRLAVMAANVEQGRIALEQCLESGHTRAATPALPLRLVFVLDEGNGNDNAQLTGNLNKYFKDLPEWDNRYAGRPVLAHHLFQYCFYRLLDNAGISTRDFIAVNGGRKIAAVIKGEMSLSSALENIDGNGPEAADGLSTRVAEWLKQETLHSNIVFVGMGTGPGMLSSELKKQVAALDTCTFADLYTTPAEDPLLPFIQRLYEQRVTASWKNISNIIPGKRVPLPTYCFHKTRCWIRDTPLVAGKESLLLRTDDTADHITEQQQEDGATGLAAVIKQCWRTVLNIKSCSLHDNFFDLGGDSIKATQVINKLKAQYGVQLDFEDMFDFPSIAALAGYMEEICGTPQKIYSIWKDVLKQEELSYDDNFFELGGHSLIANQIINRIRRDFQVTISFDDFYRYPTIHTIAAFVDTLTENGQEALPDIFPLPQQEYYPVSHAQKRLWILSQAQESAVAYNQPGLYKITTPLEPVLLQKAFNALIQRHEILRTVFPVKEGEPVQVILSPEQNRFECTFLDLRHETNPEQAALLYAEERAGRYLNLETGPLMDALVIQTGDPVYIVLLNLHHIITDGWSNGVLIHDLLTYYRAFAEGKKELLPPLKIQYKDYAAWQNEQIRNGVFNTHRQYWLQQFREEVIPLSFPADFPRPPVKAYQGSIWEFSVDEQLTAAIMEYTRTHNATLFMMLLANLYVLLYRFSGQQDITIGTTWANRDHPDLEDQLGFYVNTLAIRTQFDAGFIFSSLLEKVRENTLHAQQHGVYPFDLLVDELQLERDRSRSPLFDIMLTLQNMDNARRYNAGNMQQLEVESIETDVHVSKFDIVFNVWEDKGRLHILLEYDTALLMQSTVEKISNDLIMIFRKALEQPQLTISSIRSFLYETTDTGQKDYYKVFSDMDINTDF